MVGNILFIIYVLAGLNFLKAQTPPIFNLSTANGLPSSNVYRACQDEKGFLWIATENGLCRYDGSEIKVLDTRDGLPDNSIIHVSKGFDNQLWVCTYNKGMCILKNENLITNSDSLKIASEQIVRIVHTRKSIWLLNSRKWLYNLLNGKPQIFVSHGIDTLICQNIFQINDTSCIFFTQEGVFKYGDVSGVKQLDLFVDNAQMFFSFGKKVIALTPEKIHILDTNQRIERTIQLEMKHVWTDIVSDSKGNLWMASGTELMKLENTGKLTRYKEFFKNHPIFINDLFVDSWDNIWISTYGAGLYCLWNKDITYLPVVSEKINHNVTSLYTYNDKVFISSLGGTFTQWVKGEMLAIGKNCNTFNDYVYFQFIKNDTLIIGKNNGLCFVSGIDGKKPQQCSCIPLKEGAISGFIDSKGYLWIGHYTGVTFQNKGDKVWIPEMMEKRVNAICEYPNGTFYIGTDKGLYSYINNAVAPVFISLNENERFITSLVVDKTGNLWIGTRGGLYIRQAGQPFIKSYNHSLLSHTKISQLLETPDGALWIASHQGVYRYTGKKMIAFTRENGLISNHVLSITMDSEKRLWTGTPDGISVIGSERYDNELEIIPKLYITSISYGQKTEMYPTQVSVPTSSRNIIVSFTAIFFPASTQIKFQYRIKSLNEAWQELPNRSLVLSSLPKGKHRLEIRTKAHAPQDKTESVYLDIDVIPMFYEQLFFKIIVGVLLIVLLVLIANYRIRRVHRREQAKHWRKMRMMYLRLQAVQASLNPHFIFNSLNSILSLLKTQRNEQAEHYLSGFSKLLRNTLETNANTSITIKNEIERLNQYLALEKIRFAGTFEYEIEVLGDLDIEHVKIPVMVVQPFVENALKHGIRQVSDQKGGIKIVFEQQNATIKIVVEDNGIGYYTSLKSKGKTNHRSLGIQMVQKQLALLNEAGRGTHTLSITEKEKGQGTLVEIHLPAV